jgi:hypothetical protein
MDFKTNQLELGVEELTGILYVPMGEEDGSGDVLDGERCSFVSPPEVG